MSPISLNSLETRMKVSSLNYHDLKKPSILAQTTRSSHNSAYFKNVFLTFLTAVRFIKVLKVYIPRFQEVHLDIRNQSGCICVMSFLKAGLYCITGLPWVPPILLSRWVTTGLPWVPPRRVPPGEPGKSSNF